MPVEFLNEEQRSGYGQFAEEPNEAQLARYFLLDEADAAFISERRGELRIPLIPASDSSRRRPPIPFHSGHRFQMIAAR